MNTATAQLSRGSDRRSPGTKIVLACARALGYSYLRWQDGPAEEDETMETMNWALVDENGMAVNDERFATAADAHASANDRRGPRRFGTGRGKPMLIGRNVWTSMVSAGGLAVGSAT